jgi:hypothetical protein
LSKEDVRNKIKDLSEEIRKRKEEIERIEKILQDFNETTEEVLYNLNFEVMPKSLDKK